MNRDDVETLVLAELRTRVSARYDTTKAIAGANLADGDKRTVRSPLGDKLGTLSRTDPDGDWEIVDRDQLAAYIRENHPDSVEWVSDIVGDPTAVVEVLAEHAPHLLAQVERVEPGAFAAVLALVRHSGTPVPGIAWRKPAGVVQVRRDRACGAAVEKLVQAGQLSWDGHLVELPAGEVAS